MEVDRLLIFFSGSSATSFSFPDDFFNQFPNHFGFDPVF